MTRINLVPVETLTNRHVMAEFREIQHISKSLNRSLNKKSGFDINKIPQNFTLNTGHVSFFYRYGQYIETRFQKLKIELISRGYNVNQQKELDMTPFMVDKNNFYKDFAPSYKDMLLVSNRILERINQKPHLYKDADRFLDYYNETFINEIQLCS